MECPRCKLINPMGAKRCDCGFDFATGTITGPDTRNQQIEPPAFTQTPTITQEGSGSSGGGGGVPAWMTAVGADATVALPAEFLAVTATTSVPPASTDWMT